MIDHSAGAWRHPSFGQTPLGSTWSRAISADISSRFPIWGQLRPTVLLRASPFTPMTTSPQLQPLTEVVVYQYLRQRDSHFSGPKNSLILTASQEDSPSSLPQLHDSKGPSHQGIYPSPAWLVMNIQIQASHWSLPLEGTHHPEW